MKAVASGFLLGLALVLFGCTSAPDGGSATLSPEQAATDTRESRNPYDRNADRDERLQQHREVSGRDAHGVPRNYLENRNATGELDL